MNNLSVESLDIGSDLRANYASHAVEVLRWEDVQYGVPQGEVAQTFNCSPP